MLGLGGCACRSRSAYSALLSAPIFARSRREQLVRSKRQAALAGRFVSGFTSGRCLCFTIFGPSPINVLAWMPSFPQRFCRAQASAGAVGSNRSA